MSKSFRVSLKAGERLFINGAVIRVDRKVSIEFLNDVAFLLEHHVMQAEDTTTPLRQLYFMIQTMIIDPAEEAKVQSIYQEHIGLLFESIQCQSIRHGLRDADALVRAERFYDALKKIRSLLPAEAELLAEKRPIAESEAVPCR